MLGSLKGWFTALSTIGKVGVITGASLLTLGTVGAVTGPSTPPNAPAAVKGASTKQTDKIEHKTATTTEAIPFDTQTVDDPNLASGTSKTVTEGVDGVKTKTYDVTYTNGAETNRTLTREEITTQPVTKIVHHGTFVAASCPNGTYVNSDGNTVCSPYSSPSVPAGATARCVDGTYSFSQHRSGTCSHHGGVAEWF